MRILVAHAHTDLYGSDRQLVQVVGGFLDSGFVPTVFLRGPAPSVPLIEARGATIQMLDFPVVQRAMATPLGSAAFVARSLLALPRLIRAIRQVRPDVVYVNTLTIPVWLLAAWLCRVPVICHVREAEESASRGARMALALPMLLARLVIANSAATKRALLSVLPRVSERTTVIYNGVPGPDVKPDCLSSRNTPAQLVVVARLAPHKGIDVALDATALLAARGRDVHLTVCGTAFQGKEWYEMELRRRADRGDLAGRVRFAGYVDPVWPVLAKAHVVLVPSLAEPFGNTAVEGLLACRPVIASGVQGLTEIIRHRETGLLVPPGDASALADAITTVLEEPQFARRMASAGRAEALQRFSPTQQATTMRTAVVEVSRVQPSGRTN